MTQKNKTKNTFKGPATEAGWNYVNLEVLPGEPNGLDGFSRRYACCWHNLKASYLSARV